MAAMTSLHKKGLELHLFKLDREEI